MRVMFPSRVHLAIATLAVSSSLACVKTVNVGGFALDVPNGWYSEKDDGALAVGTKSAEWTWFMMSQPIEDGDDPAKIGEDFAHDAVEDDDEEIAMSFTEPQPWSVGGLEGFVMEGEMKDEELTVTMKMLILTNGSELMIAFGFRSPDADADDDAAADTMLQSIRAAGG